MRAIAASLFLSLSACSVPQGGETSSAPFHDAAVLAALLGDSSAAFAAGASARATIQQVIQHNIANVDTPGFKRSRVEVSTLPYATLRAPGMESGGAAATVGAQVGAGAYVRGVTIVHSPGVIAGTNRSLDVAIDGEGFLVVQLPDGSAGYTRDGRLHLAADRVLVDARGNVVQPGVTLPDGASDVWIAPEGCVSCHMPGSATTERLGLLHVARVPNPEGLRALADNVFAETEASGRPTIATPGTNGTGRLLQGRLERSNVELYYELLSWQAVSRHGVGGGEAAPVPAAATR
jgi:flagellar basal-body rod protein FlgG